MPLNTSTLRPLHIAAMPPTRPATILFLRCWVTAKLTVGWLASMPNSAAWATWRWIAAVSRNALAGMHPRLRHVPPRASSSTIATLTPADAAYRAAEYPPGPPPMMTRSNCSAVGITSLGLAARSAPTCPVHGSARGSGRGPPPRARYDGVSSQRTCSSPRRYSSTRLDPRPTPRSNVERARRASRRSSRRRRRPRRGRPRAPRPGTTSRKAVGAVVVVDAAELDGHDGRRPSLGEPVDGDRHVADLDRLADAPPASAGRPGRRCAAAGRRRRRGSRSRTRWPAAAGCGSSRRAGYGSPTPRRPSPLGTAARQPKAHS